jgi:hypothetical protein
MPRASGRCPVGLQQAHILMQQSVASSTRKTYQAGYECYKKFSLLNNLGLQQDMPPVSEDLLMAFAAHCFNSLDMSYATIKLYICGIRFIYITSGLSGPFDAHSPLNRLQLVLKGIKKSGTNSTKTRLPITVDVLHSICGRLQLGMFSPYTDILMETVCVVAFFGFLRCAEFTCNKTFDATSNLCLGDISFQDTHVILKLKQSKTDPFRKGVDIKLFCMGSGICPTCLLARYLKLRKNLFPMASAQVDSCFLTEEGRPLTRAQFLTYLKQVLKSAGHDDSKYTGHSFRIGAATSAATAHIEDHMIKTLGRWASDSYCRYIITPKSAIYSAHIALSKSSAPQRD